MADIDTISKYLIQHYPDHFARFALARDDIEVIDVIDTEQPTVESRRTDSFIRVQIGEEEALVHNEFQTTDSTNPPMPRRIDRSPKANYLAGMAVLSELIYAPETVSEIIIKEGLMDLIRESSLIQYFKQEGIE